MDARCDGIPRPVAPGPETSVRRGLGTPGHHLLFGGNINLIFAVQSFRLGCLGVRFFCCSRRACVPAFISSQYLPCFFFVVVRGPLVLALSLSLPLLAWCVGRW